MSDANEVQDNDDQYDAYGFHESTGLHRDTGELHDADGFDSDGVHRSTETFFHPVTLLTRDGDRRDVDGFDWRGRDCYGYDRDGYDADGYNEDGEDRHGCSRCENGECDDSDCERCNPPGFEDQLDSYSTRADRHLRWRPDPNVTLYAGHEIEMYSRNEEYDDVQRTLDQLQVAYRKCNPLTPDGRCAIAKHDGSLGAFGFETVTVPLTDAQVYGIFEAFDVLGDRACAAWSHDDNGHHIHLSRAAIGPLTLGKMMVFMHAAANKTFISQIAGRGSNGYARYSQKKLTDTQNHDRYEVLNVTDRTVEFRLFKANLYSKAILKNYEFCKAVLAFCQQAEHGFGEVESGTDSLHWVQFRRFVAANRGAYRYLHQFMLCHRALRMGYVNWSGLPDAVAHPKERSPVFTMIRTTDRAWQA